MVRYSNNDEKAWCTGAIGKLHSVGIKEKREVLAKIVDRGFSSRNEQVARVLYQVINSMDGR